MYKKKYTEEDIEKAFDAGVNRGIWIARIIIDLSNNVDEAPLTKTQYLKTIGIFPSDECLYTGKKPYALREVPYTKNSRLNKK